MLYFILIVIIANVAVKDVLTVSVRSIFINIVHIKRYSVMNKCENPNVIVVEKFPLIRSIKIINRVKYQG